MPASVYIETTIPSAYFETRRDRYAVGIRALTRKWWDEYAPTYRCVSSGAVWLELSRPSYPASKRARAIRLVENMEMLEDVPAIHEIATLYIREKLMPADVAGDAYHPAYASYYHIAYLLTWNCGHLARGCSLFMEVSGLRRVVPL